MSEVLTTTKLAGHAFDCYVELLHNGQPSARAYGEAKNYELLSAHMQTFDKWLRDVNFNPSTSGSTPSDLAFMIAPSCPSLLKRKLELKNINFIQADEVIYIIDLTDIIDLTPTTININTASKSSMITAFHGTRYRPKRIDSIISQRPYPNLDELFSKDKSSPAVTTKLKKKFANGEICF